MSEEEEVATSVVDAYEDVSEALSKGRPQLLAAPARKEALALTRLIDGDVDFIRLETARRDLLITVNYDVLLEKAMPLSR